VENYLASLWKELAMSIPLRLLGVLAVSAICVVLGLALLPGGTAQACDTGNGGFHGGHASVGKAYHGGPMCWGPVNGNYYLAANNKITRIPAAQIQEVLASYGAKAAAKTSLSGVQAAPAATAVAQKPARAESAIKQEIADAFPAVAARPAKEFKVLDGEVVDILGGDLLKLQVGDTSYKIRLAGIIAPREGDRFSIESVQALFDLVYRRQVTVRLPGSEEKDGVIMGVVFSDQCVNTELVRKGFVWYDKQQFSSPSLTQAEQEARQAKAGLWADFVPLPPQKGDRLVDLQAKGW
jgi:endonuclease YncB( thermonuclease family)